MESCKYNCNVCFYKTNRKNDYTRHLNKKNPCISLIPLHTQLQEQLPKTNNTIEMQLIKEQMIEKDKVINALQHQLHKQQFVALLNNEIEKLQQKIKEILL